MQILCCEEKIGRFIYINRIPRKKISDGHSWQTSNLLTKNIFR
jgi:hypothetical protein